MQIQRPLIKILPALALTFFAAAASRGQSKASEARVGLAVEEVAQSGAAQARGDEKRTPPRPEAKTDSGGGPEKKDDGARGRTSPADSRPVSLGASKVAPDAATAPPATSDAPAKKDGVPVVSVAPPKGATSPDPAGNTSANSQPTGPNKDKPAAPSGAASGAPTSEPTPSPTSVYRVGAGDVLDIRLLGQPARESTLYTVTGGGLIEYPLAGDPFNVVGMTTDEIGARIAAELRRRAVHDNPQLLVSVREYSSHTVLVSGLANDPGVKVLRREAVPLYVIVAEAQPKPEASQAVVMSHATGQSRSVDLLDTQGLNLLVYPGDVVNFIPRPQEFFYIGGEVGAPGQKDFYRGMTLTQAVLAAGGVTRHAGDTVRISRQSADGRLVSAQYDLSLVRDGKIADPPLQPGDRIEVARKK